MHTNAYGNIARQVLLESTLTTVVVSNDDINAVTCRETEREREGRERVKMRTDGMERNASWERGGEKKNYSVR